MKSLQIINQIKTDIELKEKYEKIILMILADLDINKKDLISFSNKGYQGKLTSETAYKILESKILEPNRS